MKNALIILLITCLTASCVEQKTTEKPYAVSSEERINPDLPTIGLLIFDGFLTMEAMAPLEVFAKAQKDGKALFNVILVAEEIRAYFSEEGLHVIPHFTFDQSPDLDILIVPSAYDLSSTLKNENIINYIRKQNELTNYTASNCAGAFLLGESGVADGKEIVTWAGGGQDLQASYPKLKVQDDAVIGYAEDGKIISSNGNMMTYIEALNIIEKMSGTDVRKSVEEGIYLERFKNHL